MGKPKPRRTKAPEPLINRLARTLLPAAQASAIDYEVVDVANSTDADQRHMVRSDEKHTLRKFTRIEKLVRAGVIEKHHGAACEWYANAHALGYDTLGITAQYGEGAGGGRTNFDHLARDKAQMEARADYAWAREGLPPHLVMHFEAVTLHGYPISGGASGREASNRTTRFKLCADVLHGRIAHMLPVMR